MTTASDGRTCVVFGAGALGLGFLGPELTDRLRMVFVDIPANAALLSHLASRGSYRFNETGPARRVRTVGNVTGIAVDERRAVREALDRSDLVFTAVGEDNLPKLAPLVAEALVARDPAAPLRVLCCENGLDIAAKFRRSVAEHATDDALPALLAGDTVMGRMCKLVSPVEGDLEPVACGMDTAVAGEPFYGIPAPESVLGGLEPLPEAFQCMSPPEFAAHEDIKMLAHNGLHAFLSYMADASASTAQSFCDLRQDPALMDAAHRLLYEEAAPALLRKHRGVLARNDVMNYLPSILRRITCPGLHDPLARGQRGVWRKLQPWERLVGSVRTIDGQGLSPRIYARGLAAAIRYAVRTGERTMSFEEVLTRHCGFTPGEDGDLIRLVQSS